VLLAHRLLERHPVADRLEQINAAEGRVTITAGLSGRDDRSMVTVRRGAAEPNAPTTVPPAADD